MNMRQTINEEEITLTPGLKVNYSTFEDGFVFPRPDIGWRHLPALDWVAPVQNEAITGPISDGVQFDFRQHVSVAVAGRAVYQLSAPEGIIGYDWSVGTHNVDNGGGYLPLGRFVRTFYDGFTLACILPTPEADPDARYSFEVLTSTKVLDAPALFVHYCAGIRQKQTDFDIPAGVEVPVMAGDIAIVCYGS